MKSLETITLPYLHDNHTHTFFYGLLSECVSLADVHDKSDALLILQGLQADFSVVTGWHSSRYSFTVKELESCPPLFICHLSLHAFVANSRGLEHIAVLQPEIAAHFHDQEWIERHLPKIFECIMSLFTFDPAVIMRFMEYLYTLGIYSADDMLAPSDAAIDCAHSEAFNGRIGCWVSPEVYTRLNDVNKARIKGIKLFTDGANGAYSAALQIPYTNGSHGLLVHSDDALYARIAEARTMSDSCALHAIGDRAIEQILTVYSRFVRDASAFTTLRIEHAQFITREQARRARDLGITLSMQPNFNTDSRDYTDRLPSVYCERNNPFRMLIDDIGFKPGKDLLLGSDGMPHGVIYALQAGLFPPYAGQRLTIDEFCAGYTRATTTLYNTITIDYTEQTVVKGEKTP